MSLRAILAAVGLLIAFAAPAQAWSALGHKAVAEVAWQQLEPSERQTIVDVLRRHPTFAADFQAKMDDEPSEAKGDKSAQDHWIFLQAATWPDLIRKQKQFDRP